MKKKDGNYIGNPSKTDDQGYFQFKDAFAACMGSDCVLELANSYIADGPGATKKTYSVAATLPDKLSFKLADEKAVPFFSITVTLKEIKTENGIATNVGTGAGGASNTNTPTAALVPTKKTGAPRLSL